MFERYVIFYGSKAPNVIISAAPSLRGVQFCMVPKLRAYTKWTLTPFEKCVILYDSKAIAFHA